MNKPVNVNIQYSYYYPDPAYLNNMYAPGNTNPVTYEGFKDFELIEQFTNDFVTLGDLQVFITKVTGIPAQQQYLSKGHGKKLAGDPSATLKSLGIKDKDVIVLKTFHSKCPFDYSKVNTEAKKKAFVAHFPPPANIDDLDTLDKKVQWAQWESNTADQNIYTGAGPLQSSGYSAYPIASQYFNPANPQTPTGDITVTKIIAWNGLPGLLRSLSPYTEVYKQSDKVIAHGERTNQTEYCEWKTFYADTKQKKISKIVFTCEGPEYWQELFNIDPDKCVQLYRELTGIPTIKKKDLVAQEDIYLEGMSTPIVQKGQYNFYNDYNTKLGIVHLNQRNNYLSAELNIASMSTQLQQQADGEGNLTVLQKALPLVIAGEYGSPGRNSDPTIGFICNWVARHPMGLRLTIQPPVALYFGMLNTTGWQVPEGSGTIQDWVKCIRGDQKEGKVLRYEISPPESLRGHLYVNDITIGGQAIEYGGQIARCMTVQLTGLVAPVASDTPSIAPPVRPRTAIAASFCTVDPISQQELTAIPPTDSKAANNKKKPAKHHPKRTPHQVAEANALGNSNPPKYSPQQAMEKMIELERETVLDIDDIQGDPLVGFNTSNSVILFLDIEDVKKCKTWLDHVVVPNITNTRTVLQRHEHMRRYRAYKELGEKETEFTEHPQHTYLNISFSNEGLAKLTSQTEVDRFYATGNAEAFVLGMPKRSTLLGDPPAKSKEPGALDTWKFGGERTPDIMIQVQGDAMHDCEKLAAMILEHGKIAVKLVYRDVGKRREGRLEKPREQFGFHDGISNPELRGMYRVENPKHGRKLEYITKRDIAHTDPRWNFYGKAGSSLIWPGELILGYKKQRDVTDSRLPHDYWLPGDDSFIGPVWAKNGTFVIYRRLNQNVASFWQHARENAEEFNRQFKKQGAPAKWTAEKTAANFIGRWPSGCPIMLSPEKDAEKWGESKTTQNAFMYALDTPPFPSADTGETMADVPTIPSDNIGLRCPFGAHVRKVNPRDQATDFGPDEDNLKHRLMRRGTPFGPFVAEADKFKDDGKERGLQFVAYAANIDMQFEFILRFWANFNQQPLAMTSGNSFDMVIGQPAQNDYNRQLSVMGINNKGIPVIANTKPTHDRWVYASGGGYFFMPSISAIRGTLCSD